MEGDGTKHYPVRIKGGSVEQMREVADRLSPKTRFEERRGWGEASVDSMATVHISSLDVAADAMPDVVGMGLKDALFLLESRGLRVQIEGHGRVVSQSLPANVRVRGGETVSITLK